MTPDRPSSSPPLFPPPPVLPYSYSYPRPVDSQSPSKGARETTANKDGNMRQQGSGGGALIYVCVAGASSPLFMNFGHHTDKQRCALRYMTIQHRQPFPCCRQQRWRRRRRRCQRERRRCRPRRTLPHSPRGGLRAAAARVTESPCVPRSVPFEKPSVRSSRSSAR